MRKIRKILIANRGEIAVRIARTCRELGIRTVAIYSVPDRRSPHVRACDEAYEIGPAASRNSYLKAGDIAALAAHVKADAVHPGYGFLAENADFAEACARHGVTFVGPPPSALRAMGDKTAARQLMQDAAVPVVPGTIEPVKSDEEALAMAEDVGYPILLKAAAGGGGKGMRAVRQAADLPRALSSARGEAASAFGDDRVFIEKLIVKPRHIELQILADGHGNCIHLFERECSIQRRHQKVIEEAPSPIITDTLRKQMGAAAVAAALSCGYVNAGTVEFLVDDERNFYFMEMNTRLQVEHPVTEWITGIDLVAEQIRIAEGASLGFSQSDVQLTGHAVESRIYAEDPDNDFLPDPGPLLRHRVPSGPGVRVDAGVEEGGRVEIYYDPMISKISTWGRTRAECLRRMDRALAEYEIAGVRTTIPFCRFVVQHEAFVRGDFSTHFVEDHFSPEARASLQSADSNAVAVAAAMAYEELNTAENGVSDGDRRARSPWLNRRELQ